MVKIGEKLSKARKEKGYNLRDAGKLTGLDFSYISKIEKGKVENPSLKTYEKLCNLYGISETYLFGGVEVELPEELKDLDIDWITLPKDMEKEELTAEDIRKYAHIIKEMKKMS